MPLRFRTAYRYVSGRSYPGQPGDLHLRGHVIAPEGCCPGTVPEAEAERWRAALLESVQAHQRVNAGWWADLLSRERLALTCACWRPERCVRLVIAEALARLGALYEGEETVGPLLPPSSARPTAR